MLLFLVKFYIRNKSSKKWFHGTKLTDEHIDLIMNFSMEPILAETKSLALALVRYFALS